MADFLCSWRDWNSNDVDCVLDQEIPTQALASILLNKVTNVHITYHMRIRNQQSFMMQPSSVLVASVLVTPYFVMELELSPFLNALLRYLPHGDFPIHLIDLKEVQNPNRCLIIKCLLETNFLMSSNFGIQMYIFNSVTEFPSLTCDI